jgi:hypothetical protein
MEPGPAEAFAAEQGIPRVHDSYTALIADLDIDAVYNPLPNSPQPASPSAPPQLQPVSRCAQCRQIGYRRGRSGLLSCVVHGRGQLLILLVS